MRKESIKVILPSFLKKIIKKNASKKYISVSTFIGQLIVRHLEEESELTNDEKQFIILKKKEYDAEIHKYFRSRSSERLNLIKNIGKFLWQVSLFTSKINKKELLKNLKHSYNIAKINGWNEEKKFIKNIIKKIKENNGEIKGILQDEETKTKEEIFFS